MGTCCVSSIHWRQPPLAVTQYQDHLEQMKRRIDNKRNGTMRRKLVDHFGECQACGESRRAVLEGAHIRGRQPDGTYDNGADNLIVLCANCHTVLDKANNAASQEVATRVQLRYPALNYQWTEEQRLPFAVRWFGCCMCHRLACCVCPR
jgi:heterodisulfide reductase subunit B